MLDNGKEFTRFSVEAVGGPYGNGAPQKGGIIGGTFLSAEKFFLDLFSVPNGPTSALKPPYYGETLQSGMAQEAGRNYNQPGYLTVPLNK